jgi:hypothetical protein
MSYDILAFDVKSTPEDDDLLLAWFNEDAKWSEPHSYDDASVTTPSLRSFYRDLIKTYPPLHGPDAPPLKQDRLADYSIGRSIVYVSLGSRMARQGLDTFLQLGITHRVGVCEISEDPPVIHRVPAVPPWYEPSCLRRTS